MFDGYGYQPQYNPAYQQRMNFLQQAQPQQTGLQARPVTCREEAVAATVFPGSPMLFLDRAHGMVYYKNIDPQTNAVEFVDFTVTSAPVQQPQVMPAPQYATVADVDSLRAEIAQLRDLIPASKRPQKGADAE